MQKKGDCPSLFRLILVLISIVSSLLGAELILRAVQVPVLWTPGVQRLAEEWNQGLHQPSNYPGLDYEMRPNRELQVFGAMVKTNSLGLRSPEISREKPAGVKRVVILGDSLAFGWGVEYDQTFGAVLERLLNDPATPAAPGQRIQVVNLAVSGYNTRNEVAGFFQKGVPLDPDLVIVAYFLNDPEIDPVQPLTAYYQTDRPWKHVNLLRLLRNSWLKYETWKYGDNDYFLYLHRCPRTWRSVTTALLRLSLWSKQQGRPIVLVIFPDLSSNAWPQSAYGEIHDQVASTARSLGFTVLDLYPAFSPTPRALLTLTPSDSHPSPLAHDLAARELTTPLRALLKNFP